MKHRFTVSEKESEVQFHRVSQDLLTHNPKQGVNYWGGAEYPTMLIWAGRIYDFLRVLEGIVGHYPARMQSYTVGYTSGWNGADVGARLLTDAPANDGKTQLLSSGSGILSGAGWGRCEIEYDDATGQVHWIFPEGTAIGLAAPGGTQGQTRLPIRRRLRGGLDEPIARHEDRVPGVEVREHGRP